MHKPLHTCNIQVSMHVVQAWPNILLHVDGALTSCSLSTIHAYVCMYNGFLLCI